MSRLDRTIAKIKTGDKCDVAKVIDLLAYIADNALIYADEDGWLMDKNGHDIEDACDWAVAILEKLGEEDDSSIVDGGINETSGIKTTIDRLADVVAEFRNEIDEWGEHSDEELRDKTTVDCQWFRDVWLACSDALALLREQEPRVLTLEDVCGGDECWIEYRYGGNGYADVYLEEPGATAKVYRCHPVGYKRPETVWLHDYGKLWRGWTSRPTDEQRKAVKWDG